jgi:hypothetical protein
MADKIIGVEEMRKAEALRAEVPVIKVKEKQLIRSRLIQPGPSKTGGVDPSDLPDPQAGIEEEKFKATLNQATKNPTGGKSSSQ